MRDWRNRQTRAFKGRVGDRVGSSPTSRTTKRKHASVSFFHALRLCLSANLAYKVGRNTPLSLRGVRFTSLRSAERQTRAFKGRVGDQGLQVPHLSFLSMKSFLAFIYFSRAFRYNNCTINRNLT